MSSEKDTTLKPSKKQNEKKKRGFWARLRACFTPRLTSDQLKDDAHVDGSSGNFAANSSAKKVDDEGNSNRTKNTGKTTEETMVQSSPTLATSNGASSTHDGANGSQHPQHHQQPPHLTIPTPSVVITAPSTPAYNTFDLDPDPDVVIPPTPSKATHLLPQDETEGVTSGAVQPPGGIAHPEKDETDRGTFTDDDFHDAKEEDDIDAEEMRLILNAGSGIPIVNGEPRPLLPPLAERHRGRKCLVSQPFIVILINHCVLLTSDQVLDMDETLLHSSFKVSHAHLKISRENCHN
jgi:RNA polymerase II subunit A small phosphatase-like protein